jgi:hypothetical protein
VGQVFVSHSHRDEDGIAFLRSLFGSVSHEARFYSWDSPRPPHAESIRSRIEKSESLFVLLSPHLERAYTKSWVTWEIGVAVGAGRNVWALEKMIGTSGLPLMVGPRTVDLPVPGLTGYLERPSRLKTLETEPFYSLVKNAGTQIPIGPEGNELREITCPKPNCLAAFRAYWQGKIVACPVCRRQFKP